MDLKESKLVGHQELVEYNLSLKEMEILLLFVCLFLIKQLYCFGRLFLILFFFSLKLSYMLEEIFLASHNMICLFKYCSEICYSA